MLFRSVYNRDNKWDMINLAWSLNPNSNFDFTYYKFRTKKSQSGFLKSRWVGLRSMIIPNGITGGASNRFGFLMGFQRNPKWGIEIGYFHDPTTIPFSQILSTNWDNNDPNINERYRQKPTKDEMTGFPSEFSRLTGLSFSIFFDIDFFLIFFKMILIRFLSIISFLNLLFFTISLTKDVLFLIKRRN